MKKICNLLLLVSFVLIFFVSCSTNSEIREEMNRFREPNGKVKVMSTIAMIDDIVKQVGGDYIDSVALLRGDLDPHSYQLVKGDDEKLFYADIVFYNGLGLEHGPSLHNFLETSPKAIGLGNLIMDENPSEILRVNGQLDPHIWMDISLWKKTVPLIVEALSKKDPAHAKEYEQNGFNLIALMEKENQEVLTLLKKIPDDKRYLVTSHDAFNYFTKAYLATDEERKNNTWQVRFAAPEGLAPDSQLSTTHIQEIIDYLKKHNVHVLFPESNISKDSIRKIVDAGKEIGLNVVAAPCCLYADAMGEKGSNGDTYLKMIKHNAEWISKYILNEE